MPQSAGALLARGKRPSAVTGGYESSTDDDSDFAPAIDGKLTSPPGLSASSSFTGRRGSRGLGPSDGRRRTQSLMSPIESTRSPTPEASGSDVSSSRRGSLTRPGSSSLSRPSRSWQGSKDLLRPSGVRSPEMRSAAPSTRISSQRSSRSTHFPTSRSEMFFGPQASAGPSRLPSGNLDGSRTASARVKEIDRVKERGSSPDSKKGKAREDRRVGGLAASLGLGSGSRDLALSPGERLHFKSH
jgi:hypothetical protein